jgi:nucleoside-diphosphate-sugar epimerase
MKTDLVTGACGFSGSYLVKELLERGRGVRATDLERAYDEPKARELREILDLDYRRDGVEWVPSDLTRPETLDPLFEGEVGCLFHTASLYDYSAPWEWLEKVNVQGVTNLLEAALRGGVERMVHWSTCGVYGHANMPGAYLEKRPWLPAWEMLWNMFVRPWQADPSFRRPRRYPTNQPMTENRSNPRNTPGDGPAGTYFSNEYSRSKWIQEQIVWRYHREKGLPVTVIRPAPIYGPGSEYGATGLMIEISEGLLPVYPAGAKWLLFGGNVHARDLARAAVFLSEREDSVGEDYNVADSYLFTHREAIEFTCRLLGRRCHFVPGIPMWLWQWAVMQLGKLNLALEKRYPRYRRSRVMDMGQLNYLTMGIWVSNRKIRSLGFEFEYADARQGLADTVAWLIEHGRIQ